MPCFRRKTLDAILKDGETPQHQLKRTLNAFDVVMLGIGAIVGAGIFATIGTAAAGDAARPGAGPALILSFVITAVACGFAALCYAEFAAMVPISGSAYTYSYATLGELVAWIIGWDLIIEYAVGNVAVAISWGNYFKTFVGGFGITIPDWLSTDYRTAARIPGLFESAPHIFGIPIVFNILAIGIVALITIVLVVGIRESATLNTAMVGLKLLVLGLFVVVGWGYMKTDNWEPFAPNGWAGIQAGAAVVFFAYIGFDAVSTVAEEVRNPKRDLPIGIIGSLIICTVIYVIVATVFTGIIPYDVLVQKLATEQAEPLTMALQYANIERWGNVYVGIVAFGSVVAHTAVLLVFQLGQPQNLLLDGARRPASAELRPRPPALPHAARDDDSDGRRRRRLRDVHEHRRDGGPHEHRHAVRVHPRLRRDPDSAQARTEPARAFKTPFVPFVPIAGIISCIYLMMGLPWITWVRFGLWLALGLVIYFMYGFRRSGLARRA